jgi:hypothetical protein
MFISARCVFAVLPPASAAIHLVKTGGMNSELYLNAAPDQLREANVHCPSPILAQLRRNELEIEDATESVDASRPELLLDAFDRLLAK